jgi:hypothetical protein
MMAAQLYASHAASIECYRRAMLPGQSIEAKQINLTLDAKGHVAYCPPPEEVDRSKPLLKHLGGSRSDHWNQMLCNRSSTPAGFERPCRLMKEEIKRRRFSHS